MGVVTVDEPALDAAGDASALPDGIYTLTAIAADAAGNSSGVSNSFYLHRRHRSVLQPPARQ